jgi:hypothetical protein
MKSIIIEEKNLALAVEKGLRESGFPKEFQIKIVKEEQGSFLSLWKKGCCKIVFTYDANFEQNSTQKQKKSFNNSSSHDFQNKQTSSGYNSHNKNSHYSKSSDNQSYGNNNYHKKDTKETYENREKNDYRNERETQGNTGERNKNRFQEHPNRNTNQQDNNYSSSSTNNPYQQKEYANKKRDIRNNEQHEDPLSKAFGAPHNSSEEKQHTNNNYHEEVNQKNTHTENIWSKPHVDFITEWIITTAQKFNLSKTQPIVDYQNNIIKISMGKTLFPGDPIKDKHLSSSLVVMIHEAIRAKFNGSHNYNNKIIIMYEN